MVVSPAYYAALYTNYNLDTKNTNIIKETTIYELQYFKSNDPKKRYL